ncbi:MAG TPA: oxidative damage protection protein [Chloroflexota bacterium]|jgi:Fe-S cluster biosynthesis and repair protein YggX|nr:oxidative damage protection protein [Chloroflexota bacterium]
MARTVHCAKLGRDLPGLERPPIGGELGQRIFDHVSQQAWEMWESQATLLMNHYGLSMGDPEGRKFLRQQMEEFLFTPDPEMPAEFDPATVKGGTKGGAPAAKK